MPISLIQAALAVVVMALASAVQGSVGFGAALLAAPVLLLIHPAFVPAPILASNLVLTLLVARREWSAADMGALRWIVSGRVLGTLLAAGLLARLPATLFDALFGAMVLAAVALSLRRGGFRRTPRNLSLAGLASGLMGTLSSIGGPPVALVYQDAPPAQLRATLGVSLLIGATLSLAAVWGVGRLGQTEVKLAVLLVPAALSGFWMSQVGVRMLDPVRVRAVVLVLSALAAVGVLLRAITAAIE